MCVPAGLIATRALQDVKQVAARYRGSLQFHSGSGVQVVLQERRCCFEMVALCHYARPNAAENACTQACMRVVPAPTDEAHPGRALRQSTLCRNMSSLWNQYLVLNGRAVAAYTRNPANMAGRTIMAIFVAVFAGMVFMNPPAGGC